MASGRAPRPAAALGEVDVLRRLIVPISKPDAVHGHTLYATTDPSSVPVVDAATGERLSD